MGFYIPPEKQIERLPVPPKLIRERIEQMIDRLNQTPPKGDVNCTHHGVFSTILGESIQISTHGDNILIILEINQYWVDGLDLRHSKKTWDGRVTEVSKIFGTKPLDIWNGEEGFTSMSLVYKSPLKPTLKKAQEAYRNMKDVFKPSKKEEQAHKNFGNWYDIDSIPCSKEVIELGEIYEKRNILFSAEKEALIENTERDTLNNLLKKYGK